MHHYLKALPLALPAVLAACGVASPDNPAAEIPSDQIAPTVLSVDPTPDSEVDRTRHQVTITFSEDLDKALVEAVGNLKIEPALPNAKIAYNGANKAAIVTWDEGTLPYNVDYVVTLSGALADLAGNKLGGKSYKFRTPKAVEVKGVVQGLAAGQKVVLIEKISNTQIEVSAANPSFKFPNLLIPSGSPYLLAIATQPSGKDFCSIQLGSGTATNQSIDKAIICSQVVPYFASAPNWNDYIALDNGDDPLKSSGAACDYTKHDRCYHAGELRKAYVPESLVKSDTTCANLTARDHLDDGWFNWTCVDDATDTIGRFKMVATKLKDDVNLSNLLLADSLLWRQSMVMFQYKKGDHVENVENLGASPWWHNPVVEGTSRILNQAGTVYVLHAKTGSEANSNSYQITADRVAAITTAGSLRPTATSTVIEARSPSGNYLNFLWLETDIDATGSGTGLALDRALFSVVRNTVVANAEGPGITLDTVGRSTLKNVTAKNNGGSGIYVYGISPESELHGNTFNSITAAGNGFSTDANSTTAGHGIHIKTKYGKFRGIRAVSNKGDGIFVEEDSNNLADLASYSNSGNGLSLHGAIRSTVVGGTLAANGGAGLRLATIDEVKAPSANVFANITSILNSGDGVAISGDGVTSSVLGNSLIRVVSALNGGNGLQADAAVSKTAFVDNVVNRNNVNCSLLGATNCPAGISVSDSDLSASLAIKNASEAYLRDKVLDGFNVKVSSGALLSSNSGAGPCETGCRELDLRLKTADTLALKKLALPETSGAVESHAFSAGTSTEFLAHAHEILGDHIGNDNGLCETNETCVFNPNLGAYQGEGSLDGVTGTGTSKWEAMGITLKQYKDNGYEKNGP